MQQFCREPRILTRSCKVWVSQFPGDFGCLIRFTDFLTNSCSSVPRTSSIPWSKTVRTWVSSDQFCLYATEGRIY